MARILIIEDNPEARSMLNEMLSRAGHDVITAENGNQGIELYQKNPTNLVITDILMPEKDGVEVICELKEKHPALEVIAISGGGRGKSENYLKTAEMLDASYSLKKPFSQHDLFNAVNSIILRQNQSSNTN